MYNSQFFLFELFCPYLAYTENSLPLPLREAKNKKEKEEKKQGSSFKQRYRRHLSRKKKEKEKEEEKRRVQHKTEIQETCIKEKERKGK